MFAKIWSWIEKNRYVVIVPVLAMILWIGAVGCTPTVQNPVDPTQVVNADELEDALEIYLAEHEIMLKKFGMAADEIERQKEQMNQISEFILTLASGSVADLPGLITLLMGSGLVGLFGDNIRKNAVIGGLKRNK